MRKQLGTEAIVLKKKTLLNKDSLVLFLTETHGKIAVYAKGIRKITSRRSSHIQTANLVKISLYEKDNRYYLQETTLTSGFTKIKDSEEKRHFLYILFFVLERILPENQKEEKVYHLTKKFLIELSETKNFTDDRIAFYLNNLMQILGYLHQPKSLSELYPFVEDVIHDKIPLA